MTSGNHATNSGRTLRLVGLITLGGLASCSAPAPSPPPRVTVSAAQPVAASADILNATMMAQLAPGVVATLRVSPKAIVLQQASMMLVPKRAPQTRRTPDSLIVATLSADGVPISTAVVPDPVNVFVEDGQRPARPDVRTVTVAIPTRAFVDTMDVFISSTGQMQQFKIAPLLAAFCAQAADEPLCRNAPSGRTPLS